MSFVSTRDIGGIEVSAVASCVLHWTPDPALDRRLEEHVVERDRYGRLLLGCNWLCIKTDRDVVLVDPAEWRAGAPSDGPLHPTDIHGVEEAMSALGIAPHEVTHVVVSHGHVDHVTGLSAGADARFPAADVHFPARDFDAYVVRDRTGRANELRRALDPVDRIERLRLTSGDAEICTGVSTIAACGESPGHQVVRVGGTSGTVYYLGDLLHWPFECLRPEWTPLPNRDLPALGAARRHVLSRLADERASALFTHATPAGWGRVEPEDRGWRWTFLD